MRPPSSPAWERQVLEGAERHGGLAGLGNLEVREDYVRRGVGVWLLAHASAWLRLAHVDRLLAYALPEEVELLAFLRRQGFVELTRTRRGWRRGTA